MVKYSLKKITAVKGKISIYKLLINDCCEFDDFCQLLIEKHHDDVIGSIHSTLEGYANLLMLPKTRFRELKRPKSDKIKDYEVKSGRYRAYLFKDYNGGIVVFGGTKGTQDRDIKRFRSIKQDYIKEQRNDNQRTTFK